MLEIQLGNGTVLVGIAVSKDHGPCITFTEIPVPCAIGEEIPTSGPLGEHAARIYISDTRSCDVMIQVAKKLRHVLEELDERSV